jgi:hypothetical protein
MLRVTTGAIVRFNGCKIRLCKHREIDGRIKSGSFSQDARGRWYCNLVAEYEPKPLGKNAEVGIDLGLKEGMTLSTGAKVENSRMFTTHENARAQGGVLCHLPGAVRGDAGPLPIYRAHQRIARRHVQLPPWHGQGSPEVLLREAEYLAWVPSPGRVDHSLSREEAALELPQKQRHGGTGPQGWGREGADGRG